MKVEMINRNQLSERFEAAFNQIHEFLKKTVKIKDDRFQSLLNVGANRHLMIKDFHDDLTKYAKLRNVLVHEKTDVGYYIAEPHVEIVERIEKISTIFTKPNYALNLATKDVIYFDYEDTILVVIQAIKRHAYSQYPIYKNKKFVGLLRNGDIVKWMAEHVVNSIVDLSEIKVRDIIVGITDHPVMFVPKSIDIFEIEDVFELAHQKKQDIEAVIITENGNQDESPLGLFTAWDLIEIDYTVD